MIAMHSVLLLTIDCLRADRLGCGGSRGQLSPRIDQLAKRSTVFAQAYATGPRTAESFPGILASTYPLTIHGSWDLPAEVVSLAQVLARAGYATAAFHSNPFLSANLGYSRGFDIFWDSSDQTPITSKVGARIMPRVKYDSALYRTLRRLVRRFEASVGLAHYVPADMVTDKALDWLEQQSGPFLLWVHYMDMHYPYAPPDDMLRQLRPEGIGKRQQTDLLVRSLERPESLTPAEAHVLADLYDAGLLYVDQQVDRLLNAVDTRFGVGTTVVILTGDHGEEFLEHGQFGHGALVHQLDGDRTRIRLYDELLHVPLIIRTPKPSAGVVDLLASLVDIPPTVADLVGAPTPETWQGVSLKPLLTGETVQLHRGVFSEYAVRTEEARLPVVAYRTQQWKYIHDGASGHHELYDLLEDPGEQANRYRLGHAVLPALQEAVRQHLLQADAGIPPTDEAALDAKMVERLVGLGYLE